MVREVTFKVYKFEELSDEVKEKVLDDNRYILVEDYTWWDFIYDEAEEIGIEIEEFDLDRRYIKIRLNTSVLSSVENVLGQWSILAEEYKLVKSYYDEIMKLDSSKEVKEYLEEYPEADPYDAIYDLGLSDVFYDEYVEDMKRIFLRALKNEFNYLTSDEAIIEYFNDNNYEFFENGKILLLSLKYFSDKNKGG